MKKNRTSRTVKAKTTRRAPARRTGEQPDQILAALERNILFRDVQPRVIKKTLSHFTRQTIPAGDLIFDEYSKGRELYLLCSGRVRIKKYTKFGVESLLAVLHPGDFFGELSLIDGLPRSARADAMDECIVLTITADAFRELVAKNQQIALNLLHNLGVRLRTMDQTFVMELGRNALASKNKLDKLSLLIEATKIVNSVLNIDSLLGLIMDVATRSISADRGTLYLIDRATDELWSKVAQGVDMVEIRLPVGKGLAGYVARTGEIVNITNAYQDARFNPEIDKKSGYSTQTVLCMPMRNREGVIIGVFQLLNKRTGHFGPEDEAFIDALSVHAAMALENAQLAQRMVEGERLSAVGRMASSILHDIKNPLATMRLYADIIRRGSHTQDPAQLADQMIRQIDRFNDMAEEILDFAHGVSEISIESVALGEVLDPLVRFIETDLASHKIVLVRDIQYNGTCQLDVDKLARAVYNLTSNAVDVMPDGGTLTLSTASTNGYMVIGIGDTGPGIPEEVRSRLFEPFFTHGKRHGTGLGLSIVKKIMDEHRGRVEVDSTIGKGTIFRLFFPL
ncbi:MAG: cyclic nucleotide-binding domain-containing protein [Ignavibacteriae bacterium]|nr:cyclic nucleotide-binding domain-containing protein [Ignavibacteriota bacterium]